MSLNDFTTINVLHVGLCKVLWPKFISWLASHFAQENAKKLLLSSSHLSRYKIFMLFKKINFFIYIWTMDYLCLKFLYINLITTNDNKYPEVVSILSINVTVRLIQMTNAWHCSWDLYAVLCISSQELLKTTFSSSERRFTKACHVVPNTNKFLGRSLCLSQLRVLSLLACSLLKYETFLKIKSNSCLLEQVTSLFAKPSTS